jgi:hypothetical protein
MKNGVEHVVRHDRFNGPDVYRLKREIEYEIEGASKAQSRWTWWSTVEEGCQFEHGPYLTRSEAVDVMALEDTDAEEGVVFEAIGIIGFGEPGSCVFAQTRNRATIDLVALRSQQRVA